MPIRLMPYCAILAACKMIFEFASALGDRFYPFAECTFASVHFPVLSF